MPFPKWKRRHNIEHGGESGKVIGLFGDNQFTNSKPLPPPPLSKKRQARLLPINRDEPKKTADLAACRSVFLLPG
ncbi:hypothetical protein [Janthinobacterium sp. ROICE36]|uniref:hypothetical protein n=1 Tax=Janthinobacterium sp. ROICE36 TaxID=2048670 RepID=UPI0015E0C10B|nr:hypothetical protein [Janthinobacterium sp. ROICE36]